MEEIHHRMEKEGSYMELTHCWEVKSAPQTPLAVWCWFCLLLFHLAIQLHAVSSLQYRSARGVGSGIDFPYFSDCCYSLSLSLSLSKFLGVPRFLCSVLFEVLHLPFM